MSLDFDVSGIANYSEHFPDTPNGEWNGTIQSLVWASMAIGLNPITEKNAVEFYQRMNLWIEHIGPFFRRFEEVDGEMQAVPIKPTLDDVKKAVGLQTNVSFMTRTAYMRKFADAYFTSTIAQASS